MDTFVKNSTKLVIIFWLFIGLWNLAKSWVKDINPHNLRQSIIFKRCISLARVFNLSTIEGWAITSIRKKLCFRDQFQELVFFFLVHRVFFPRWLVHALKTVSCWRVKGSNRFYLNTLEVWLAYHRYEKYSIGSIEPKITDSIDLSFVLALFRKSHVMSEIFWAWKTNERRFFIFSIAIVRCQTMRLIRFWHILSLILVTMTLDNEEHFFSTKYGYNFGMSAYILPM